MLIMTTIVAKYLVRVNLAALDAADDVPPFDRREITKAVVDRSRPAATPKHAVVPDGEGFRCLWCLKTSPCATRFRGNCQHAPGHLLWKAGDVTICTLCGAFADKQTVLLTKACRGVINKRGKSNLKRVFDSHCHPVHDIALPVATHWQTCAGAQLHVEPTAMLLLDALGKFFKEPVEGEAPSCESSGADVGESRNPTDADTTYAEPVVTTRCDLDDKNATIEGAGEVFAPETFAFGDDAFRARDSGSDADIVSPLVVDRTSSAAVAAALDLGDEAIKRAFYDKTKADGDKYSDAVSGIVPSNVGKSTAGVWSAPRIAPNRFPDVLLRETSRLRGRFSLPGARGLSSSLFGQSEILPCTDDLLGHGVRDDERGFNHDQFFGLDHTGSDDGNAAVLHPRSRSADVTPHRKCRRLRASDAAASSTTASSSTAGTRPRSCSNDGFPQQKRYRLVVKQTVPGL